jgi:hypothetical protein
MKKRFFQTFILVLVLFISSPVISYSLNVHSKNVQKENIPMLNTHNNINYKQKDVKGQQLNMGQMRSRMVHIRNNIRQFLQRFDILDIF